MKGPGENYSQNPQSNVVDFAGSLNFQGLEGYGDADYGTASPVMRDKGMTIQVRTGLKRGKPVATVKQGSAAVRLLEPLDYPLE